MCLALFFYLSSLPVSLLETGEIREVEKAAQLRTQAIIGQAKSYKMATRRWMVTHLKQPNGGERSNMKTEDLQKHGLTEEQITYVMAENGKDIKKLQKQSDDLTVASDAWKEKAEAAEATLKKFEGIDPEKVQGEIADWKKKAEDVEKDYAAKLEARDFDDALKAEMESMKFSSNAARKAIEAEIKAGGLKLKNGKILGLNDLINQLKESDADAFVPEEDPGQKKAVFTQPMQKKPAGGMTKDDIMAIKDRTERQSAIAANAHLFPELTPQ